MQPDLFASVAPPKMAEPLVVPVGRQYGPLGAAALADQAERQVSALYRDCAGEFFSYAVLLCKNEELSQDALQESFMRYFVALCSGRQVLNGRAWIYRVMRNYLLDRMKESRTRRERSIEDLPWPADQGQDVEARCYHQEVLRLVRATLAPRELQCVQLRSEGFQYEEIAAALRLRSGTVGALISRAVRKMRAAIQDRRSGR